MKKKIIFKSLFIIVLSLISWIVIRYGCTPFDDTFPTKIIILTITQITSIFLLISLEKDQQFSIFYALPILLFFLIMWYYNPNDIFENFNMCIYKYFGRVTHMNALNNQLFFFTLGLVLFGLYFRKSSRIFYIFFIILQLIYLSVYFFILKIDYDPDIDTITVLNKSISKLLKFENPYLLNFSYTAKPEFFHSTHGITVLVYWGINLFLLTPFYYLFGDVRYCFLFFSIITYFSFFWIEIKIKNNIKYSLIFASIYLLNPYNAYIIIRSFTESISIFFLFLYFYYLYKKNFLYSLIFISLLISTKQYFVFFLPVTFLYFEVYKSFRKFLFFGFGFIFVFSIFHIPFLISDFDSYFYNTIKIASVYSPRWDSLSWTGYIFRKGNDYSLIFQMISFIFIGFIYFLIYKRKENLNIILFSHFCILFSLLVYAKVAFGNYYYITINSMIFFIFFSVLENSKKQNLDF